MALETLSKAGTVRPFTAPPADFNPLKADDQSLFLYGFPPRPQDPDLLKRWEQKVSRPFQFIEPVFRAIEHKRRRPAEPPQRRCSSGAETSENWSGVVVHALDGIKMTWIEGEWTVPNVFPPSGAADGVIYSASTWIGLDGDGSRDLLQAGCDALVRISGGEIQTEFDPWWQWAPGASYTIANFPTTAGDTLECLICMDAKSKTQARIFLANQTSRIRTAFSVTAPSGTSLVGNCAEWIVEALELDTETAPELANYGNVYFDAAFAGAANGRHLGAGNGNVMNMLKRLDPPGPVISRGCIENAHLVKCTCELPL